MQSNRRRNRRRHDGNRGAHVDGGRSNAPRVHNPYRGPLADILQPVVVGTDMTMDMSLEAFNALFERQMGGYLPVLDFNDRTGASITGLKNADGLRATIIIKGLQHQVAAAYELLLGRSMKYTVEEEELGEGTYQYAPPAKRRRRRR